MGGSCKWLHSAGQSSGEGTASGAGFSQAPGRRLPEDKLGQGGGCLRVVNLESEGWELTCVVGGLRRGAGRTSEWVGLLRERGES